MHKTKLKFQCPMKDITNIPQVPINKANALFKSTKTFPHPLTQECDHNQRISSLSFSYFTCMNCGAFISLVFLLFHFRKETSL